MSDLTTTDLSTLRRLLAAATPGPWRKTKNTLAHVVADIGGGGVRVAQCGDPYCESRHFSSERWNADATLIAALVNAAPALIEMAERVHPNLTCHGCGEVLGSVTLDRGALMRAMVQCAICGATKELIDDDD